MHALIAGSTLNIQGLGQAIGQVWSRQVSIQKIIFLGEHAS